MIYTVSHNDRQIARGNRDDVLKKTRSYLEQKGLRGFLVYKILDRADQDGSAESGHYYIRDMIPGQDVISATSISEEDLAMKNFLYLTNNWAAKLKLAFFRVRVELGI